MMHFRNASRFVPLLLVGLIAACGGAESASEEAEEMSAPPPDEGLVLDSTDFAGIEAENVAFNLHWVQGPVNRDAERLAPPVNELTDVTTLEGGSFDRVIFHLGEGGIPGYEITWADSAAVDCATNRPVDLRGDRKLRVHLISVTTAPTALRAQDPRYENLEALVGTCADPGGTVDWYLGLQEQAQIRVIEMRSPRRLVVDVRHEPPGGN